MSKALALALVLVFLILVASCVFWDIPAKAQHQSYITINSDGSVSPSSAPIIQNGNTYTLMENLFVEVNINKNNIIFNGNGHTINQYSSFRDNSNADGIILSNVSNVIVTNTTVINSGNGIYAIQDPSAGIFIYYGGSNIITGNNFVSNFNGIFLHESNNNVIMQNNITDCNQPYSDGFGIGLWGASNNKFYQNNLLRNERQVVIGDFNSKSVENVWDNSKEGNFWDDYNGTDADGDGIGDTPYKINIQNTDDYPLMQPFNSTLYALKTTAPTITFLSPTEKTFNESDVPLSFLVDKPVNWTRYVLDEISNVTLSGNTTLIGLANGLHNITVYAQDTFGNIGSSQTINFIVAKPESVSFPVVSVAAIAVVAVVVAVPVSILLYRRHRKTSLVNYTVEDRYG